MVLWQWKHATVPPIFVHVNVNSSCYEKSWEAYRQLGYIKTKEYGRVDNMLYKALCIPDPGIAKLRSMIKLPNDSLFAIDLIEWENPRTVRRTKATETTNNSVQPIQFAVAVADVPCAMDDVMKVGRCKPVSSIKRVAIPFMSEFAVSAIVADPDGLEVELISFPVKNKDDDRLRRDENQGKKVVLISGCDSGFGRSLACRTASLGFKTVAACYTESGAAYLKDIATTVVADFGTKEGTQIVIQAVFAAVESVGDGGQLWSVINNAAVCLPGNVEWLNPDNFEKAMNVNFYAPVKIIYGLLPLLKISKGRIINVSSVCGMVSQPSNAAYCSTKHALESYSDCLRCEMAPFGVNVVIVQPTTMRTPLGMSYFNAWSDSYMSAPGDRQASYSKKWIDTVKKKGNATLEAAAEDPMDVVNAIANALITAHTPTRLPVGRNAFLFFRPVSFLPDSWRDAILFKAVFGSNQISGES